MRLSCDIEQPPDLAIPHLGDPRTIARLNLRFRRDTVSFASTGRRCPWKLRREFLSPCYTTAWDELLRV
jgi:hypothetical protein